MAGGNSRTPGRPLVLSFPYRLSPKGIENYVAATGAEPAPPFLLEVALTDLTPALRARAASLREALPSPQYAGALGFPIPTLDGVTDEPALLIAAWEQHLAHAREQKKAAAAAQRERERLAAEESRQFKERMRWWIADHGSPELRLALQRDYNVVTQYLRERLARELPGFAVDANRKARWEERANPSPRALALETEALEATAAGGGGHVRIVWLTRGADGTNYKPMINIGGSGPRPREAVIVDKYLDRYLVLRDVDAPETTR